MPQKTKRQRQVSKIPRKKGRFISQELAKEAFEQEEIMEYEVDELEDDIKGILFLFLNYSNLFLHTADYHLSCNSHANDLIKFRCI